MMSTGPLAQDQLNFVWTSKFFGFYLELHVYNKFKNLIRTNKINSNFHFEDCSTDKFPTQREIDCS